MLLSLFSPQFGLFWAICPFPIIKYIRTFDQGGGTATLRPNQVTATATHHDRRSTTQRHEPRATRTPAGDSAAISHNVHMGERTWYNIPLSTAMPIPADFQHALMEKLFTQGIIIPSFLPWAAPVSLVKKKDGSMRLCIEYRQLNAVTVRDPFPLPRMDELLQALAGKRWFATLGLSSSYWQIEVKPEDRHKMAFILSSGLFEFKTLPMGLANAAATCRRVMQQVLQGLLGQHCLMYLDDVIIFGKTQDELLSNLSLVLQRYQ